MRAVNFHGRTIQIRQAAALAAASFLALFLFFSMIFLVREAGHDCIGEDCPVCAEMLRVETSVQKISAGVLPILLAAVMSVFFLQPVFSFLFITPAVTPVSRKIRMNN